MGTSHNRTVYASPLKWLGLHSARSWLRHSHASFRQIGAAVFASQSPYMPPPTS